MCKCILVKTCEIKYNSVGCGSVRFTFPVKVTEFPRQELLDESFAGWALRDAHTA